MTIFEKHTIKVFIEYLFNNFKEALIFLPPNNEKVDI